MASVAYQMYIKNKNSEDIFLFPKKPLRDFEAFRADKTLKGEEVFGKHYIKGILHDGTKPSWPHQHVTKTKLQVVSPNKNEEALTKHPQS